MFCRYCLTSAVTVAASPRAVNVWISWSPRQLCRIVYFLRCGTYVGPEEWVSALVRHVGHHGLTDYGRERGLVVFGNPFRAFFEVGESVFWVVVVGDEDVVVLG